MVVRSLIQNLCDGDGELRMSLRPGGTSDYHLAPPLHCSIPGSSVIMAQAMIDAGEINKPRKLRAYIEGSFRHTGQHVRFARRTAVTKRVSPALTAALLLAGHLHAGGGTVLNVDLVPAPDPSPSPDQQPLLNTWQLQSVWTAEEQTTPENIAEQFSDGLDAQDEPGEEASAETREGT